ncbi:MAG TPA: sugar phosphate isomerase/epimerase [Armatimonadota bacterium]|jgi:sugar phosphate isomerase/epimerase
MGEIKIVAQLYTLRDECAKDYAGTMRAVAAIGYKYVQVSGFHGLEPQQIRETIDDAGMRCVSTHESYDAVTKDLDAVIARNRILGAETIICPWVPGTREETADAATWQALAAVLNTVGRAVRKAGLTFGYHNHDHEFRIFNGRYGMDILMEGADPENVALELDAGWAWFAGVDPAAYLRKYPGRAPIIHAKDHDTADKTKNRPVGDGALNWPPFWDACRAVGTSYAAVEEDTCILPPIESMARSFNNMVAMGLSAE